jgi:hypothetical protein
MPLYTPALAVGRSALIGATLAVTLSLQGASWAPASRNGKETKHAAPVRTAFGSGAIILIGSALFQPGSDRTVCAEMNVTLVDKDFFGGLVRVRKSPQGAFAQFKYYKGGHAVEWFPDAMMLEIRIVSFHCRGNIPGIFITPSPSDRAMARLRFEFSWVDGTAATTARIVWSARRAVPLPADGSYPQWRYDFRVISKRIPITAALAVQVISPEGRRLIRVVAGLDRSVPQE